MQTGFYRALEDKYRGTQELISSRQIKYIKILKQCFDKNLESIIALDLGCGRGEWLELLTANGAVAQGIDIDVDMLEICHSKGLKVTNQDLLGAIKNMESESLDLITGFHVAEHLKFSDLMELVTNSYLALKPGGVLIFETPNPENIVVSTSTFYLDPSHVKPIPKELLSFLIEYCGFEITGIIRLNADKQNLASENTVFLEDVLCGIGRDYAVIAQKPKLLGGERKIEQLEKLENSGFQDLVVLFDAQLRVKYAEIENIKLRLLTIESPQKFYKLHFINFKNSLVRKLKKILKKDGSI